MANTKNRISEFEIDADASIDDINFDVAQWESEQIGFPPYWNPSEGKKFLARVIARDERDPAFVRYVLQAQCKHTCQKGPSDDAEPCEVRAGEYFTCSVYAALPLTDYYGVVVLVTAVKKRKLAATQDNPLKRDMWDFNLKVSPTDHKMLAERKVAQAKQLGQNAGA
jgi:hypothetical protein